MLPEHPALTPLLTDYVTGTDPKTSLGPHWQRPGRTIFEHHLQDIQPPPDSRWRDLQRVFFTGTHHPALPAPRPPIMRARMTWNGLMGYLRTFSVLHTYHERNPEDLRRADGDIAVRLWRALMAGAGAVSAEEEVLVDWPLALVMVKRA